MTRLFHHFSMPNPHWLVDIAVWSVGHLQTKQICILVRPAPKPLTPNAAGLVPCWRAQPLLDVSVRGPSSHRRIVMRELQPGDQVAQGKTTDDLVGTAPEWTRTQHCILEPGRRQCIFDDAQGSGSTARSPATQLGTGRGSLWSSELQEICDPHLEQYARIVQCPTGG